MKTTDFSTIPAEQLRSLWQMTQLFTQAVQQAQAENHAAGLPNVYSLNGTIFYQYPNGDIVMKPRE